MASEPASQPPKTPALEWIASSIGAVFGIGLIGFLIWDAATATQPANVSVYPGVVEAGTQGYRLSIVVQNAGGATAAEVEVEGRVTADGKAETSTTVFDYVPGESERRGTLVFTREPRAGDMSLRVVSYREP